MEHDFFGCSSLKYPGATEHMVLNYLHTFFGKNNLKYWIAFPNIFQVDISTPNSLKLLMRGIKLFVNAVAIWPVTGQGFQKH